MSAAKLHISDELSLPIDIVTMRVAIFGTSDAGKTTFARLVAEQVHAAKQRFCAIDLKNDWWGLKSSADGTAAGIPIVIFGGPKRDIQIFPDSGAATADTVASIEQSCVIDLDDFNKKKQLDFLTAFLGRLYDVNRKPLFLIPDEADRYAPQQPGSEEAYDSLGASEDICRRGRKRGIGSMWVTQRNAVLNKSISNMCDMTVIFRTPGSRDLKELKDSVGRIASEEQVAEVMKAAPGLNNGEAIFLSAHPKLRKFMPAGGKPLQMPMPWTFDSSATPRVGQRKREPKVLAETDLVAIQERMAAQVERAKADDPKHLRSELSRLQRELASKAAECSRQHTQIEQLKQKPGKADPKQIVRAGELAKAQRALEAAMKFIVEITTRNFDPAFPEEEKKAIHGALDSALKRLEGIFERKLGEFDRLKKTAGDLLKRMKEITESEIPVQVEVRHNPPFTVTPPAPRPPRSTSATTEGANGDGSVSPVMQRILDALAELEQLGAQQPARELVAFMADYTNLRSKGFSNAIGALRTNGLIDYPTSGTITLTEAGRATANYRTAPRDAAEVQERICSLLGGASSRILRPLIAAYPAELTREQTAADAGYTNLRSKGFANAIGRLRSLGFVDYPTSGTIRANPVLFLEGVS